MLITSLWRLKIRINALFVKKNVTKSQRSVDCAYCNEYYHIECIQLSVEQHILMTKNKIFKYICDNCAIRPKFCNIQEELKAGFAALTASLEKELEIKLQESRNILNEQLECGLKQIENKFNDFLKNQPKTASSDLETTKSDIKHCFDVVKVVDNEMNGRLSYLELQCSIMQRRQNRANIVIKGLPTNIKDRRTPILNICSLCDVSVTKSDIQHCTYFGGGKSVLGKFNLVQLRDEVTIKFIERRNIKLDEVFPPDLCNGVQSSIYLNDHLTEEARKLISVCRRLKRDAKIS